MSKKYRKLTEHELKNLVTRLQWYPQWLLFRNFAYQCYGPSAYKIEVEVYGEYDDEGGTDYRVTDIEVFDEKNRELKYDISAPFFQEIVAPIVRKSIENNKTRTYKDDSLIEENFFDAEGRFVTTQDGRESLEDIIRYEIDRVDIPEGSPYVCWDDFPVTSNDDLLGGTFYVDQPPKDIPELFVKVL